LGKNARVPRFSSFCFCDVTCGSLVEIKICPVWLLPVLLDFWSRARIAQGRTSACGGKADVANYVARVLKGEKPADLPVQQARAAASFTSRAAEQNRQSVLRHDSRISLAQESRIESRTALRGNDTRGSSQASENVALTRCDGLAMLQCVSLTTVHNMVGQPNASFGNFSLALLEALAHVVREHWHTAALFCKFSTASQRAIPRIGLLGGRLIRVPISV
jgi:hypothetical protein